MSTPIENCKNCGESISPQWDYCPNCGQKDTDGRITVRHLFSEFFDAVFNIESRTILTFLALFVPGKLTAAYFAGKHRKYVHPLRTLFVMSILLIVALSYRGADQQTNHNYILKEQFLKDGVKEAIVDSLVQAQEETSRLFGLDTVDQALDTLHLFLRQRIGWHGDSINLGNYFSLFDDDDSSGDYSEVVGRDDLLSMSPNELVDAYGVEGWFNRQLFRQKAKFILDESRLSAFVVGSISWITLLMMPLIAFIIRLFYMKQEKYYVEHLIFTFHLHSFYFFVLSAFLFIINLFSLPVVLSFLLICGSYGILSLKRVYQESWKKTIFKFSFLSLAYFFSLLVVIVTTFLISFFIF